MAGYYDRLLSFVDHACAEGFMPAACREHLGETTVAALFEKLLAAKAGPVPPLNGECFELEGRSRNS